METLSIVWADIIELGRQMGLKELALPLGALLWGVLLFLPLINIDRRDVVSGFTYVIFMMFSAVLLILVLPQRFFPIPHASGQSMVILCTTTAASIRWFWRRDPKQEKIERLIEESEA